MVDAGFSKIAKLRMLIKCMEFIPGREVVFNII